MNPKTFDLYPTLKNINEDELDFFSDELVDYLLLCPIVYCPKEELQYTNP